MKNVLKLEEAAMFGISIYLLTLMDIKLAWWLYPILYLAPDVAMIGYLANNKIGATLYNIGHSKTLAIIIAIIGFIISNDALLISGIILFGHSSMDRMFGFGLKLNTGFKHTHLGVMK